MEQLLPSEIARLIYGYLEEHGCHEAALKFLEQSPHLLECLSLYKDGKRLKTRVDGYSLMNLLDEYCEVRNLVSERLQRFPENNVENLRHGGNLLAQLKFLLDATKPGETLLLSITVPPQGSSGQISSSNVSSVISNRSRIRLPNSAERAKRSVGRTLDAKQLQAKDGEDHAASNSSGVLPIEATPLESLPGLMQEADERSEIDGHERSDSYGHEPSSGQHNGMQHAEISNPYTSSMNNSKSCDKEKSNKTRHSSFLRRNSVEDDFIEDISFSLTTTPKRKQISNAKRKNTPTPSKLQTPGKLWRSQSDEVDPSENLNFPTVYQAFLDNRMHERIAEITNRVIRMPVIGESIENVTNQPSTSNMAAGVTSYEPSPAATVPIPSVSTCDNELNQVIKTIVEQTEQDPLFERFLQEIIPPMGEEMTPSPTEMQSESDEAPPELVSTEPSSESSPKDTEDEIMPELTPNDAEPSGNVVSKNEKTSATVLVKKTSTVKELKEHHDCQMEQQDDDKESEEVPLKQRLRSARQRKSEGSAGKKFDCCEPKKSSKKVSPVTSSAASSKEKKESTSLEDENAAAVQSIVDAKIILQKIPEPSNNESPAKKDTALNDSVITKGTKNADSSKICIRKSDEFANQQKEKTQESSSVQQKEVSSPRASNHKDTGENITNCISNLNANEDVDVIIFDPAEPFLDSGANFMMNSSVVKNQTVHPSVGSSSQIMTITIPGATNTLQQNPSISGVTVQPPSLQSHSVATSSTSSVVTISIPGSLNPVSQTPAQYVSKQQDLMAMSTVIMCGNDGMVPQFISLPQLSKQESANSTIILSSSDSSRYVPIAPRLQETTVVTSLSSDQLRSKRVKRRPRIAESTTKISSTSERKIGVHTRSQNKSKLITIYAADDSDRVVELSCNIEQPSSTSSLLSLPKITESPPVKLSTSSEDGVTSSLEPGREKLLGALNLKELQDSSTNVTFRRTKLLAFDKSVKRQAETNKPEERAHNFPTSPHRLKLVNLSKHSGHASSRHKDSPKISANSSSKPESKNKLIDRPRETPKPQSRNCVNSKRRSLSTPRRRGSHVRSLDFTTPPKTGNSNVRRSNTSPKGLDSKRPIQKTSEKINKAAQRLKTSSAVRSSLFQSPENGNKIVAGRDSTDTANKIPPIATRSPAPQLTGDWDKVTGVGLIFGESSPVSQAPQNGSGTEEITEIQDDTAENGLEVIEDQDEIKSSEEQPDESEVIVKSILDKDNKSQVPFKPKIIGPKFFGTKSNKTWDSDLRALIAADYEGGLLSKDSSDIVSKPQRKGPKIARSSKNTKYTRFRKKALKVTEEEAQRLEASINEEICHDNGSDVPSSSSDIPLNDSVVHDEISVLATIKSCTEQNINFRPKNSISENSASEEMGEELTGEREKEFREGEDVEYTEVRAEKRKKKLLEESEKQHIEEIEKQHTEEIENEHTEEIGKKHTEVEKEHTEEVEKEHVEENEKEHVEENEKEHVQENEKEHVEENGKEHTEEIEKEHIEEKEREDTEEVEEECTIRTDQECAKERKNESIEEKEVHADNSELDHTKKIEEGFNLTAKVNLKKLTNNKMLSRECEHIGEIQEIELDIAEEIEEAAEQNKQQNESIKENGDSVEENVADTSDSSSDTASTAITSPNTSVGSNFNLTTNTKVIQSPTKLKAARRTIVHNSRVQQVDQHDGSEDNLVTCVISADNKGSVDSPASKALNDQNRLLCENVDSSHEVLTTSTQSQRNDDDQTSLHQSSKNLVKDSSFTVISEGVVLRKTKIQVGVCDSTKISKSSEPLSLDTPRKEDGNDSNPWKSDFLCVPMTPRVMSPNPNDTPLTKVVPGSGFLAVSVIETPSFPPTPQIAVTPKSNDSQEYSQSYSTSSTSYYKPSGEHDLSNPDQPLEQLLISECQKLESHSTNVKLTQDQSKSEKEDVQKTSKNETKNENVICKTRETDELICHTKSVEDELSHKGNEQNSSLDKSNNSEAEAAKVKELEQCISSASSLGKPKRARFRTKKRIKFQIRSKSMQEEPASSRRKSKSKSRNCPCCSDSEEEVNTKSSICDSSRNKLHRKTQDEIIQSHIEAAKMELFGNQSPSDDYDFDSSDTETKQKYPLYSSKPHCIYSDDSKSIQVTESRAHINESVENSAGKNIINAVKKTVRFKCDEIVSLSNELEEKRRRTVAKLKEINISSKQSKRTKSKIEEKSSATVQNKFPLKGNTSGIQVLDAEEKNKRSNNVENKISTETIKEPVTNVSKKVNPESSPTKRNSHISVEAIADRLTREKTAVAVQHVQTQRHCIQAGEENSCDEFGSLHLTSEDDDSQTGTLELSQVENKLREMHGGKESTVNVQSSPMPLQDVCKALEMTPTESPSKIVNTEIDIHVKNMENEQTSKCENLNKDDQADLHETLITSVEEGQDGKRKRNKLTDKEANVNKKLKILLGKDESLIKKLPDGNVEVLNVRSGILHNLNAPQKSHIPITESEKESTVSRKIPKSLVEKASKGKSPIRSPLKNKSPSKLKCKSPIKVKKKVIKRTPIKEKETAELKSKSAFEEKTKEVTKLRSKLSIKGKEATNMKSKSLVEETTKVKSKSSVEEKEKESTKLNSKSPVEEKRRKTIELTFESSLEEKEKNDTAELQSNSQQKEQQKEETVELQSNLFIEQKEKEGKEINMLDNKILLNKETVFDIEEHIHKTALPMSEEVEVGESHSMYTTKPTIQKKQLDINEFYIEIVYPDEGHKVTDFIHDDISHLNMSIEVDGDSDGESQTVICTTSGFQELFTDIPIPTISTEKKSKNLEYRKSKSKAPVEKKNYIFDSSRSRSVSCTENRNDILDNRRNEKEESKSSKVKKIHSGHEDNVDYRARGSRKCSPSLERRRHPSGKHASTFDQRRLSTPLLKNHTFSSHHSKCSLFLDPLRLDRSPSCRKRSPSPFKPIRRHAYGIKKSIKHKSPLDHLYKECLRDEGRFSRRWRDRGHAVKRNESPLSERVRRGREWHTESQYSDRDHGRESSHTSSTSYEMAEFGVDDGSSKVQGFSERRHQHDSHSSDVNKIKDVPSSRIHSKIVISRRISTEASKPSIVSKTREHSLNKSHSKSGTSIKKCNSNESDTKKKSDLTSENATSNKNYQEKERLGKSSYSVDVTNSSRNKNTTNVMEYNKSEKKKRSDEPLEEGELVDDDDDEEDSLPEPNAPAGNGNSSNEEPTSQKCPKPVPSEDDLMTYALVGSERVENSGEETLSYVREFTSQESSEEVSRPPETSLQDKTTHEPEKPKDVTVQKEGCFGSSDGSRTLPPKKRKASSEDMILQVEKKIRVDDPQFLLKKINVDRVLDYIHGEKPG